MLHLCVFFGEIFQMVLANFFKSYCRLSSLFDSGDIFLQLESRIFVAVPHLLSLYIVLLLLLKSIHMLKKLVFSYMKSLSFIAAQLVFVFFVIIGSKAFAGNYQVVKNLPLDGVELEVGVAITPPFVIAGEGFNNLSGIDIDLIYELQKRTGFTFTEDRIHLMNFGELLDVSSSGNLDITGGAITLSEDREHLYEFSDDSCVSDSVVVVHNSSKIDELKDLRGKTVAAEVGTVSEDILPQSIASTVKMKHSATNFMQFYDVSRGHADAIVVDHAVAVDYIKTWQDSNLKIAFALPKSENGMGLLFKKDDAVSKHLTEAFHEMKMDGTVDAIVHKYIPHYKKQPSAKYASYRAQHQNNKSSI